MHILVVEDDAAICQMVVTYLRRVGFAVTYVEDGIAALTQIHTAPPDLILLDLGLPKITGWQVIRRLKARADTKHIPIIALTAYALDIERRSVLDAGCDDFEPKPINFESLIMKIKALGARLVE